MPAKKKPVKLTQEELFPHGGFHYRLYTINVDGKKGFNKTAWFQCEDHLTKHIQYKHQGVKYSCDQCEYQSIYQSHLARHIDAKH